MRATEWGITMRATAFLFINLLMVLGLRASPVCFAESDGVVVDGMGNRRALNYVCPQTLGVGTGQREFWLVVKDPPLDNATIQFSRKLPIVKDTGGTSLDQVHSGDLRIGFYYLVTWRGEDHQIHPTFWRTPLFVTKKAYCVSQFAAASCVGLELFWLGDKSGKTWGPYYAFVAPSDFILNPKDWVVQNY